MGHTAEIVSLNFNTEGSQIITGSFDHTTKACHPAIDDYGGLPSRTAALLSMPRCCGTIWR